MRRAAILEAARTALLSRPPAELTLESLDRAAGLRQGAASMYFGSLEGLVAVLFEAELGDWLGTVEELAAKEDATRRPETLAELLADTLCDRPLLCRLLASLPSLAARRTAEMDRLLDMENRRLARFREAGAFLEARWPFLGPGGGAVALRRATTLATAVEPLLNPPSGLLLAMNDPELAILHPDPREELRELLAAALANRPGGR